MRVRLRQQELLRRRVRWRARGSILPSLAAYARTDLASYLPARALPGRPLRRHCSRAFSISNSLVAWAIFSMRLGILSTHTPLVFMLRAAVSNL